MTAQPDIVVLADHSVLLAIPAFAPAIVVVGVVVFVALRDRRKKRSPEDEKTASSGQDGTP